MNAANQHLQENNPIRNKDGYYYGYDSGSGDGLFEPPPDPIMDAAKLAMQKFAPSGERQQRVRDYFRGKDKNVSGKVIGWINGLS